MSRFVSAALVGAALLVSGNAFAYDAAAGKATYDASCATCHKTGMMAPRKLVIKPHGLPVSLRA